MTTEAKGGTEPNAAGGGSKPAETSAHVPTPIASKRSGSWVGRIFKLALLVAVVGAAAVYGYPAVETALSTVSTDDAYVNSHVTFVAPRIAETVMEVRVDNNDFVKAGDLIVVLDKSMQTIRVAEAEAALGVAQRDLVEQLARARAASAEAKADRYKLMSAMTGVRNQVAELRSTIATHNEKQASEKLAKLEFDRYTDLARRGSVTQEQADVRRTDYDQSRAAVVSALEKIHSIRVSLEVPESPATGKPYDDVPVDLDQHHSSVQSALAAFSLDLANLGLALPRYTETPNAFIDRIHHLAPNGDLDVLIEQTVEKAPSVESARARIKQSEEELALARLQLTYCDVHAEIDGFVSNRNVNRGDRVTQGQRILAIRSFREVWIDCNFKETQLPPIRIGHPVDLYLDAYPGKVFKGRVSGFSAGTGSSLALLPAQNATGNFVKIVQRLPVRVDLVDGNPPETPLFVGLSAIPYVRIREQPQGPDAGQRLRGAFPKVEDVKTRSASRTTR